MAHLDDKGNLHDDDGRFAEKPQRAGAAGAFDFDDIEERDPDIQEVLDALAQRGHRLEYGGDSGCEFVLTTKDGREELFDPIYGEDDEDQMTRDFIGAVRVGQQTYADWAENQAEPTLQQFLDDREISSRIRRAIGDEDASAAFGDGWLGEADLYASASPESDRWIGDDPQLFPPSMIPLEQDSRSWDAYDLSDAEELSGGLDRVDDGRQEQIGKLLDRAAVKAEIVGFAEHRYTWAVRVEPNDGGEPFQVLYHDSRNNTKIDRTPSAGEILCSLAQDSETGRSPDFAAELGYDPDAYSTMRTKRDLNSITRRMDAAFPGWDD